MKLHHAFVIAVLANIVGAFIYDYLRSVDDDLRISRQR